MIVASSLQISRSRISYMGDPSTSEWGGIVFSFMGGAILSALSISFLADRFGRKMSVFGQITVGCRPHVLL